MCCFSGPVHDVSSTKIFARGDGTRQCLAYSMRLDAGEPVAMILPLPVEAGAGEDALSFIDLSGYPDFFERLDDAFPVPQSLGLNAPMSAAPPMLAVVRVGSFEASFVPSIAAFDQLDPRFRLSTEVWSQLPDYAAFGFAVFKLVAGARDYHPMAFSFPRAESDRLFFPTVHVHDGRVHDTALFDHMLYAQLDRGRVDGWSGMLPPSRFVSIEKARGLVHPSAPLYRRRIGGRAPNRDVYLE